MYVMFLRSKDSLFGVYFRSYLSLLMNMSLGHMGSNVGLS
jgi:hypothetical protein